MSALGCFLTSGCLRIAFDLEQEAIRYEDSGNAGTDAGGPSIGEDASNDDGSNDAAVDASGYSDAADPDASPDAGPVGPSVLVSNLEAAWSTPNWIRWRWDTTGVAGDLRAFDLVIATSQSDLEQGIGSARSIRHDLEAAGYAPDYPLDQIEGSVTDEHAPDTLYFARMTAIDRAGWVSRTEVTTIQTTPPPTQSILIFADADTPGYSIPGELVLSTRAPFQGTHHYEWRVGCADPVSCYQILRRQELGIDLSPIDRAAFDSSAYFEFAAASDSTKATRSRLRIWFDNSPARDETMLYEFGGWPMATDGRYRVYQIPLRILTSGQDSGVSLTYEIMLKGLYEFGVDGEWSSGSLTRIDEWRIRW